MISLITCVLTVMFTYALFSSVDEKELAVDPKETIENESNLVVNGPAGRYVTLSCQTCRKLKRHKEFETDLYQCVTCKRQVDLRRVP